MRSISAAEALGPEASRTAPATAAKPKVLIRLFINTPFGWNWDERPAEPTRRAPLGIAMCGPELFARKRRQRAQKPLRMASTWASRGAGWRFFGQRVKGLKC